MKKLRDTSGETLVETLAAMLIVALIFLFLSTAIVTASKVNDRVRKSDVSFHYSKQEASGPVNLDVREAQLTGTLNFTVTAGGYTENGYSYYAMQPQEDTTP